jgi:hypothetical protein
MNRLLLLFCLALLSLPANPLTAQSYQEDVSSIDNIIHALYASISGEKGEARDWDRFNNLFAEGALLTPTQFQDSLFTYRQLTPEEYIKRSGKWLVENGFFEKEISRKTEQYANIAHVFSTYASRRTADGDVFMRGINSIQLFHDGSRWWILSVYWAGESTKHPLPKKYLDQ